MRTVTAQESAPFRKRAGERFWTIGLPLLLTHGSGDRNTPFGLDNVQAKRAVVEQSRKHDSHYSRPIHSRCAAE